LIEVYPTLLWFIAKRRVNPRSERTIRIWAGVKATKSNLVDTKVTAQKVMVLITAIWPSIRALGNTTTVFSILAGSVSSKLQLCN
jgi:hypothetical protein